MQLSCSSKTIFLAPHPLVPAWSRPGPDLGPDPAQWRQTVQTAQKNEIEALGQGGSKWSSPRPAIIYGVAYFHLGAPGETARDPGQNCSPNPHGIAANVVLVGYG